VAKPADTDDPRGLGYSDAITGTIQNRIEGGCVAQCLNGTECDGATGLCEKNPCAGQCILEKCDRNAVPPLCVRQDTP
jgi:hypothetical protein